MASTPFDPPPGYEAFTNYYVPREIQERFEQDESYEVVFSYTQRLVRCRCGCGRWELRRSGAEFRCECIECGEEISFGTLCYSLFDMAVVEQAC